MSLQAPSINDIAECLFRWMAIFTSGDCKYVPSELSKWTLREWRIAKSVSIVHGMGPVIGYLLSRHGDSPAIPVDMNHYLREQFEENRRRIHMITQSSQQISQLLEQNEIDFFYFKGLTTSKQLYPDVGMRPMADIDIYVDVQDKDKLSQLLGNHGFTPHVIDREGMTLFPVQNHPSDDTSTQWQGTNVIGEENSLWYQGESCKLPYSIDIHFTMDQGIQEFRYNLDAMFRQALKTGNGLSAEQNYVYLLLHAAKHLRCRSARWIQFYDLHLFQRQVTLDDAKVLAMAIEHDCCHLMWWSLQMTSKLFSTEPSQLEKQLQRQTSWRFLYLMGRHNLVELSHCNPQDMGLWYALLWTRKTGHIIQWLKLSAKASNVDFKRDNTQLHQSPSMVKRMFTRIIRHFRATPRAQWRIFALQGLHPQKDWN